MQTGSLMNQIYGEHSLYPVPEVGMGATVLMWTDRHAATIVEVRRNGKEILIREDRAIRTDDFGMSESQQYRYEPDPEGREAVYTLRKNGVWVRKGEPLNGGERLAVGARRHYYDFSF